MFLSLLDPDPDPSVRGMDPDLGQDLDPSITKQKRKKNIDSYCVVTSFLLCIFEIKYMYVQKTISKKLFKK
jgi:hypothetical protein